MTRDDGRSESEDGPRSGAGRFDLWFYQRGRGDRYYLRLTGLGIALIIIPTLLSMALIIIFYLRQVNEPAPTPNIEITPRQASTPTGPLIQPAPPPRPLPRVRSGPNPINSNAAAATPTLRGNINE